MHLAELWRYPVKSMSGEMLQEAVIGPLGVPGDRELYVVDGMGRVVDARGRPGLLSHRASVDEKGAVTIDGLSWDDPEVARRVRVAAGEGARLVRARAGERFDILPLLVATDGAIAALGTDRRRLRPNLVLGGVVGLAERAWEGRFLRIGSVVIGLDSLRQRCIMTTWDPDTGAQDVGILRRIHDEFGGRMALNAWPVVGGKIAVGDRVELVDDVATGPPPILGRFASPS
ncbi:MAG TPA: MOSC N-terminal beta barrel domain-containing protein [Planctomycetota bacterium]|nr:MOSC N-terminal beta barrel domain-containing protein [Planctomycetota bacterium]